jgi:hypothetical protein
MIRFPSQKNYSCAYCAAERSCITLHDGNKCSNCDRDLTVKENLPQLCNRCHKIAKLTAVVRRILKYIYCSTKLFSILNHIREEARSISNILYISSTYGPSIDGTLYKYLFPQCQETGPVR